jgi:predicted RecA/RadA family phage recombinase
MAETGYISRSLAGSESTIKIVTPTGGLDAGAMTKIQDTIVLAREDAVAAAETVVDYKNPRVYLPKVTGVGRTFAVGQKVYYITATKNVTDQSGGNTICGTCVEAAGANDTTVLVDFDGQARS